MAKLYDKETGKQVDIDDARAPEALRSGLYSMPKGSTVRMLSPDGKIGTVPAERALDAYEAGFRTATQADELQESRRKKFSDRPVEALLTGAGRTLSFGGIDYAASLMGDDVVDRLKGLREFNETATMVGEIGGVFAPSGAASILGKLGTAGVGAAKAARAAGAGVRAAEAAGRGIESAVARKTGESLLGKALSVGAGGAAEGAIYGAGQAVTEAALSDRELSAQEVLGTIGASALFGGAGAVVGRGLIAPGLGLVAKGTGKISRAVSDKLERSAREGLIETAEANALRAAGLKLTDYRKLEKTGRLGEAGKWLRESGLVKSMGKTRDIAENIGGIIEKRHDEIKGFYKRLDEIVESKTLAEIPADMRVKPDRIAKRIREEILPDLKDAPGPQYRTAYKQILTEEKRYRAKGYKPMSFGKAVGDKVAYDEQIRYGYDMPILQQNLRKIRRIINDEIERGGEAIAKTHLGPDDFSKFTAAKKEYGLAIDIAGASTDTKLREFSNRSYSPSDYGTGLATGAGLLARAGNEGVAGAAQAGVTGLGAAVLNKVMRTRGPSTVSVAAGELAESAMAVGAIDTLRSVTDKAIKRTTGRLTGKGVRSAAKYSAPASALAGLSFIEPSRGKKDKTPEDSVVRISGELAELSASPERVVDSVSDASSGVNSAAPEVAMHMQGAAMRAVQFLNSVAPKNPYPPAGLGSKKWVPSKTEITKFARYVKAVEKPMSILDDLEAGTLTPEAVDAVRNVYPRLYERVVSGLHESLAENPEKVTYSDKAQLSVLFGQAFDSTFEPEFMNYMQSARGQEEPAQGQGGGGTRVTGIDKVSAADSNKSRTQQLAEAK